MDSQKYLESYGWKKGEALQKGGLKKPILVSHKFDLKGIGHGNKESVAWWETVFDGQLKSLDVNSKGEFLTNEAKLQLMEEEERKKNSPLYQMFVKGEVLVGTKTIENKNREKRRVEEVAVESEQLTFFYSSDEDEKPKKKKAKKERGKEKVEKSRKDTKDKKDQKERKQRSMDKAKKDKKAKKAKKAKKEKAKK